MSSLKYYSNDVDDKINELNLKKQVCNLFQRPTEQSVRKTDSASGAPLLGVRLNRQTYRLICIKNADMCAKDNLSFWN